MRGWVSLGKKPMFCYAQICVNMLVISENGRVDNLTQCIHKHKELSNDFN